MQLSHILYRVKNLHQAVKKLQDTGFIVEYGTKPEKAYNAIIWFEEGVFIEIYHNAGLPVFIKWFMKIFGYKPVLDRMNKWEEVEEGWCEWSLESIEVNLDTERAFFNKQHIPFKFHKAKRKEINGKTLRWELLMPNAIDFPFIMSAYVPNPKPQNIKHSNGITGVSKLIIGKEKLDFELLNQLLPNQEQLELIDNKKGLQRVEFINSTLTIEEILK